MMQSALWEHMLSYDNHSNISDTRGLKCNIDVQIQLNHINKKCISKITKLFKTTN